MPGLQIPGNDVSPDFTYSEEAAIFEAGGFYSIFIFLTGTTVCHTVIQARTDLVVSVKVLRKELMRDGGGPLFSPSP